MVINAFLVILLNVIDINVNNILQNIASLFLRLTGTDIALM